MRGSVSEDTPDTLSPTAGVPGRNPHDIALSVAGVGGALVGSVPVSPCSPAPPTLSSSQAWASGLHGPLQPCKSGFLASRGPA